MKISKIYISISLIVITLGVIFSIILIYPHTPRVLVKTSSNQNSSIYRFIENSYSKSNLSVIDSLVDKKNRSPDIIIEPLSYSVRSDIVLDNVLYNTIPRSIARTGIINNKIVALPIFLDHIEITFRSDIYENHGLVVKDRILSLKDMEDVLIQLVEPTFFPLVMAGVTQTELLDVISVLTLSLGGVNVYSNLVKLLVSNETPESYINFDLGDGWNLGVVIDKLKYWKESGIIHPQWYTFDTKQVELYSERQITSTVIMRLSTHRSWPFHILRRWQSSPFPFNDPMNAGSAIIAPPTVAYIPKKSRIFIKTELVLKDLMSKDFQEDVVKSLQLAPVHSSVDTLDREADDLRFWAAASAQVLLSLDTSAPKKTLKSFTNELRQVISE